MLVHDCTINQSPLNKLKMLLHTQLKVTFEKQTKPLNPKGQVKKQDQNVHQKQKQKKCGAITFLSALGGQELTLKESLS